MRLRPYIPDRDFNVIRNWNRDERTHVMWCANRFGYPLRKNAFHSYLREIGQKNGDCAFAATEDDGTVCGFFCYSIDPVNNEGLFKFVMVDPDKRGRGVGKEMLRLALRFAFEITKADLVKLAVFPENTIAVRCYEGVGFTERRSEPGVFAFKNERWGRSGMIITREEFDASLKKQL